MYYVGYTILGNDYQAGPYDCLDEALDHEADIRGFEGVENVVLVLIPAGSRAAVPSATTQDSGEDTGCGSRYSEGK